MVGVGVEDVALRVHAEKRLVLVLTVEIHEPRPQVAHQSSGAGGAVHPRAIASFGGHLTAQDQEPVLRGDPLLGEEPEYVLPPLHVENPLHDRS